MGHRPPVCQTPIAASKRKHVVEEGAAETVVLLVIGHAWKPSTADHVNRAYDLSNRQRTERTKSQRQGSRSKATTSVGRKWVIHQPMEISYKLFVPLIYNYLIIYICNYNIYISKL